MCNSVMIIATVVFTFIVSLLGAHVHQTSMHHHLVLLLLLALSTLVTTVVTLANCSHLVQITSNSTCVWSNESGKSVTCGSLSDVLTSSRNVANGDCVEFAFNTGVYYLPTNNITITYSAVMKAVSGVVNVTCVYTPTQPLTAPANFSYLIGFTGAQTNVTIDGIHFDRCSGPLRFTGLAYLALLNSNFRYANHSARTIYTCIIVYMYKYYIHYVYMHVSSCHSGIVCDVCRSRTTCIRMKLNTCS